MRDKTLELAKKFANKNAKPIKNIDPDEPLGALRLKIYSLLEDNGLDVKGNRKLHDSIKKLLSQYVVRAESRFNKSKAHDIAQIKKVNEANIVRLRKFYNKEINKLRHKITELEL